MKEMKIDDVTVEQLQKAAVLGTAFILRRYLGVGESLFAAARSLRSLVETCV